MADRSLEVIVLAGPNGAGKTTAPGTWSRRGEFMAERDLPPIARRLAEPGFAESAIRAGVREALRGHAQAGRDVPIWQDGRVVWVSAAELVARFEAEEESPPAA